MKNWRKYFKCHEFKDLAYFITFESNTVNIYTSPWTYTYLHEDEVGDKIEEILYTLPKLPFKHVFDMNAVKKDIMMKCRRGTVISSYKNIWFWTVSLDKSNQLVAADSLIAIGCIDDKYSIAKNPRFENYGFVIEDVDAD